MRANDQPVNGKDFEFMKRTNQWLVLLTAMTLPALSITAQETSTAIATTNAPPATNAVKTVDPASFPPHIAEIVKLSQSGLGDDVLVAYVNNSQKPYKLSANDILALKDAGLSSPVITAMINRDKAWQKNPPKTASYEQKLYAPTGSTPAPTPPAPAIPNAPTVANAPTAPAAPAASGAPLVVQPTPPQPAPAPITVVEQSPPAPIVEVVPVAPSPDYYWVPGYWRWNGTWVWVGGRWSVRPWHGAVWLGGHWGRHGRGYIWVGGRWR